MFLFLALVFGLGFVGFGWVRVDRSATSSATPREPGPSVEDPSRVLDNPKDAQAFKDLATAHPPGRHRPGDRGDAGYVALRPRDGDGSATRRLYLQQASEAQERPDLPRVDFIAPGSFATRSWPSGIPLQPDRSRAVSTSYDAGSAAASGPDGVVSLAEQYKKIAAPARRSDRSARPAGAQSANDLATVIAAYEPS
jgi:hypothetical protein